MLKVIEGFDQFQGQADQQLLAALTSAGFTVTTGLAIGAGRKDGTYALELQVLAGAAGDSWSLRTNAVKQNLRGAAVSSANHFVAVGDNGSACYSDNMIDFLPLILGISSNMTDVQVAGSTWIAVGSSSTILRSTDGMNFTVRPAPTAGISLTAVNTDGAGKWMAVGAGGNIFTSTDDGVTWTGTSSGTAILNDVACHGGKWVIVGMTGKIITTPDMTNFTDRTSVSGTTANIYSVACSGAGHWFVGAGESVRRSLDDGATWALVTADVFGSVSAGTVQGLDWSDGRWMAIGSTGEIAFTDDENTWTGATTGGAGNAGLNDVFALHGAQTGWVAVGNKLSTMSPSDAVAAITVALAPPTTIKRTFQAPTDKITVGFAHKANARGKILSITDVCDMDWPAYIQMGGVNGVAIPARNIWYYYELTIDKVAKTVTLHINNTSDLVCPMPAGTETKTEFEFTWITENGATTFIDDLIMVDGTSGVGIEIVDRIGPVQIPLRLPTADQGVNEWATASGSAHWPMVGLLPPADTSYIRSATSGAKDLFTSSDPLPEGAGTTLPILAVGVIALALKGDIDNRKIGLIVGANGSTQKEIVDDTLNTVPEYSYAVFEKAPGDVAWDNVNTVSTPFGVAVRP